MPSQPRDDTSANTPKRTLTEQKEILPGQFVGDLINGARHSDEALRKTMPLILDTWEAISHADPADQPALMASFHLNLINLKCGVDAVALYRVLEAAEHAPSGTELTQLFKKAQPYLEDLPETFGARSASSPLAKFTDLLTEYNGALMSQLLRSWAMEHARYRTADLHGIQWACWNEDGVLPVGRVAIAERTAELENEGALFSPEAKRRFLECGVFDGKEWAALVLTVKNDGTTCDAFFLADVVEEGGARAITARNDVQFVMRGPRPKAQNTQTPPIIGFQKNAEAWWGQFAGQPLTRMGRRRRWSREELLAAIEAYLAGDQLKKSLGQFLISSHINPRAWPRYRNDYGLPKWPDLVRAYQEK